MPHLQGFVAILPNRLKVLKGKRNLPFKEFPITLGEHLKKRRLTLKLLQKDITRDWKFSKETYANYEKDKTLPVISHWPAILSFLGYDPNQTPETLGEKLRAKRRAMGLSKKKLASTLKVDETTITRWEKDLIRGPSKKKIESWLSD
jgi:transcriptional regulator with XRE-family HTH domain